MADSGVSLEVAWEAPPLSQLSVTNCSAIAAWLAYFLTGDMTENGWDLVPFHTAVDFVTSLVPDNWTAPATPDAIIWYTAMAQGEYLDNTTANAITLFALTECEASICPHLDWDGDADLSVSNIWFARHDPEQCLWNLVLQSIRTPLS